MTPRTTALLSGVAAGCTVAFVAGFVVGVTVAQPARRQAADDLATEVQLAADGLSVARIGLELCSKETNRALAALSAAHPKVLP